jgi:hypothetical protein
LTGVDPNETFEVTVPGVDVAVASVSEHDWMVTGLAPDQCTGIGDKVDAQVATVMRLILHSLESSAA